MVVLAGWVFSYERDTPVGVIPREFYPQRHGGFTSRVWGVGSRGSGLGVGRFRGSGLGVEFCGSGFGGAPSGTWRACPGACQAACPSQGALGLGFRV